MPRDRTAALFPYHAPPIMEWARDREHSVLRPVVEDFLAGGTLTSTELFALRAYLVRWTEEKAKKIARLSEMAPRLRDRADFMAWFAEARFHDFDPVE